MPHFVNVFESLLAQGRLLRFDKFVGLTYNILNKTADKEGQDFPLRRLNVSK